MNIIVKEITGTKEHLAYNPIEAVRYRYVCKLFNSIIANDMLSENKFGIKSSAAAQQFVEDYEVLSELELEEINGINIIAKAIVDKFSPSRHIYIGLGNSPIPFLAQIQNDLPWSTTLNIPMGGLSDEKINPEQEWDRNYKYLIQYLDQFFSKALLEKFLSSKKDILIIDYVRSGFSIRIFRDFIIRYLEKRYAGKKNVNNENEGEHATDLIKQLPHRVKVFSIIDFEKKHLEHKTLEQISPKFIELPPEANGGIHLGSTPHLHAIGTTLLEKTLCARGFTLFDSIPYPQIIQGKAKNLSNAKTFHSHLRFTAELTKLNKAYEKENGNDSCSRNFVN